MLANEVLLRPCINLESKSLCFCSVCVFVCMSGSVNVVLLLSPSRFTAAPRPSSGQSTASSSDSDECDENYVTMQANKTSDEPVCKKKNTTAIVPLNYKYT